MVNRTGTKTTSMTARRTVAFSAIAWGEEATDSARLILAAKTAVAATIAWYLAPLVPWADSEYSYYAPLGVLVSMYPTLVGSAKAGLQALIGLATGIGLGLGGIALVLTGAPGAAAMATVITVGILLGGISALGIGRDWVVMAGLFVLLIGGPTGEEFTLSYLLTMAFGVVVGVLMNLITVPSLFLQRASGQLTMLRDRVRTALDDLADALSSDEIDPRRIADATSDLPTMLASVGYEVREAEESSRGNPRGRRHHADQDLNARRMTALERTTAATRDLAAVLIQAAGDEITPDRATSEALAESLRACAEVVGAAVGDSDAERKLAVASDMLDAMVDDVNQRLRAQDSSRYTPAYAYAAVVCVHRIVIACREFVSPS